MASNTSDQWSIRDLARTAGTTVRTIHYYIAEGLLPPPRGSKRNASYSPAHLARLRLITALRDEGMALASIRSRLAPLSDDQVMAVARHIDERLDRDGAGQMTTLGLIEAALSNEIMSDPGTASWQTETTPQVMHLSLTAEPDETLPSVERREDEHGTAETASAYLNRLGRSRSRQVHSAHVPPPRPVTTFKRDPIDRPEAWYHFRVADGIELRVREDHYREAKGRMRAVLDALRTTLWRYGLSPPDATDDNQD